MQTIPGVLAQLPPSNKLVPRFQRITFPTSWLAWACSLLSLSITLALPDADADVQIYNYCDGYDVAKLYASDITVQFGNDVPAGNIGFRIGVNGSTNFGYTEYQAYCDGQANTTLASSTTFGQPLSLYGQSGTYDIIAVFGLSVPFSGSVSIVDGVSGVCPHGWMEVHAPLTVTIGSRSGPSYTKRCDRKEGGGGQCQSCDGLGMARYSAHSMLASLNIEDTPFGYSPPRGPAINFTVTYNQRDTQQSSTFNYSNLGPKWTFNWLSYVTDDPNNASADVIVYVSGGGAERFSGFDSGSQSYQADPQSHAVLVRTAPAKYEKRFPDGSKQVFALADGSASFPRNIFMTQWVDPAGNVVTIGYDTSFRLTTITDAIGQITTIAYELASDPLKITRVTEPFSTGRFASFAYNGSGQLESITDEIGIQSVFAYATDVTDFISSLHTPYGTSTFSTGQSEGNRWIEMTDPLGAKERVEYRDSTPGIGTSDTVAPTGMTNSGLNVANTFYWDKKAMEMFPPVNGIYDYTKAKITHWTSSPNGLASGILASEKAPLENRVWYSYAGQADTNRSPSSANPSKIAQILSDGSTQLWQHEYNSIGKMTKSTDPVGRVLSYVYDTNNIDLLQVRQTTGNANELLRKVTYNSQHEPLTETDAAGQLATFTYNPNGQILTRKNAKNETTTFAYGGAVPDGYLASITGPPFNSVSGITTFTYDSANRVRTVTDLDGYTITTDYDNLDRPITVAYPDGTNQQFEYSQDFGQGATTILDLTRNKDRRGLWTTRHYNPNRQMDSITDPLNRTTQFGWCSCGSLATITDPKNQVTRFNRDLQGRIYQKVFADNTTVNYLYEGQAAANIVGANSRLKSSTDARNQKTNYFYFADDNVQQITYTDVSGQPLNPATPSVSFTYDPNYNRVKTMVDGIGTTTYGYNPIAVPPALGAGQLSSIDGPLLNDTIAFGYDQLGRITNRSINGSSNFASWMFDSLGRVSSTANKLGTFSFAYANVTDRLNSLTYPDGSSSAYTYFPNNQDKRLQEIRNQTSTNGLISQFDYTYDPEGQITNWTKNDSGLSAPQRFDLGYDNADQLLTAPLKNASTNALIKQYTYGYDLAANRTSELVTTTTTTSTPNSVNEIISQSGGANRTLTYDLNGSLINDGATRSFEWDGANRLVAVNYTGTNNRTEFSYDGLSRMVKIVEKTRSRLTSTRKFVWCGMEKCEFRDDRDAVTLFVYPQGQVSGKTSYFYTRDHLGSIREMRSASGKGAIVARFDYDPYGRSTAVINNTLPDFNFTGLYRHSASNLDLAVYRAYDPDLGRWLSRDPIGEGGGINLYGYTANDPLRFVDPFGLFWFWGRWGGPNLVSGQVRPESDPIPNPQDPDYRPPIDTMDVLFERHDRDMHRANNLERLPCESDEAFARRKQSIAERADAKLAEGLKYLPWYYQVGPLNLWRGPAEALFSWGPHKHGYH
jgi:RHS repeat-associated protein